MIRIFKLTVLGTAMCTFAVYPFSAYAFGPDWFPRIFRWFSPQEEKEDDMPQGYVCHWKNGFGDCVVYRFAKEEKEAKESSSVSSESSSEVSSESN